MNRNQNSRFYLNPVNLDIGRSRFNMGHEIKTSFNVGDIIPFDVQEVLPGDTFQIKTSKVIRMQPLVSSPMDNLFLDTYYFFVPNRLVWNHWKEFMGENTESAWIPTTEYTVPQLFFENGAISGSIADYMGIPTNVNSEIAVSALPFRAYAMICNEWFRDENLCNYMHIDLDDSNRYSPLADEEYYSDDVIGPALGGAPYKAAKTHDYFTSALPGPQKGPDVSVLGQTANVYFGDQINSKYFDRDGDPNVSAISGAGVTGQIGYVTGNLAGQSGVSFPAITAMGQPQTAPYTQPQNWLVDVQPLTVNALRLAFQIQKLYEKEARSGSRYIEILKGHFGVTAPDASLQRPQYLGGSRKYININQVLQTSESGTTPQGNIAGYSLTSDTNNDFVQSFTEHGFIIGLMVARYDHTYQQGLNRMWSRKSKLDYYFPVLANIGEQPILNKEIYTTGGSTDDEVFGYQEAWADYRYKPSIVTGEMRSNINNSLDSWHFADYYNQLPTLGDSWIREDKSNIDRVLAVSSSVSNQLFADIYIDCVATRPMPMYSIPGLIDHH